MYALYLIAFLYHLPLTFWKTQVYGLHMQKYAGKKITGFEPSVSKIIACIALYCFGQSLMGTLLSQAEFYAVEIQAEIEHTSESRSKSNLISSLVENVGCVGFLPPPPSQQFLSCQVRATFFLVRNSKRVASLSLIQKPIRANSFENV